MKLEHKITHILTAVPDGRVMEVSYLKRGCTRVYVQNEYPDFLRTQVSVDELVEKGYAVKISHPLTLGPNRAIFMDKDGYYFVANKHMKDKDPNLKPLEVLGKNNIVELVNLDSHMSNN